jgi:hypothetical protein
VLVDKHQADLFYSLQLLFEDRLGHTVYTPVGHEWWDEGIWRFGEGYGDDRLARQFLMLHDETLADDGMNDGHHPERRIRGIFLDQARTMDWAYVVATVQDNQTGFHRFAEEVGARYVLQVGNTGQDVNWSLDPLALVSSEVPIKGRGLLYHQEFDSGTTFRFRLLPADPKVIRSFVNCFPSTPCHNTFTEVTAGLPDFTCAVHGIDGPDGNVAPVERIASLMAGSGWGWHDKIHGDGFGHVIHNWAAIGRPLIGHAAHYRGMMAEPFWEDGVTCIDLDKHDIPEVIDMIRSITGTPQHAAMCATIRWRFDTRVNYEAEAEQIRAFLA